MAASANPNEAIQRYQTEQAARDAAAARAKANASTYDKVNQRADAAAERAPVLGTAGKELSDSITGTAQGLQGLFTGNGKDMKQGAKKLGESVLSAVTGGALRALNNAPPASYVGGSKEALAQRRDMYMSGIGQGNSMMGAGMNTSNYGVGMLDQAGSQAQTDRNAAYGLMGVGMGIGNSGIGTQNQALNNARYIAASDAGQLAQLQLQQGLDRTQRAMMAQASAARGGNQAAAIRNAQAQGSQMALDVNQQAAQMQAAEQQARIARMMQAEQMGAGIGGQQMGLGYGLAGQGLGAAQGSTSQLAGIGSQISSAGLGQANIGLGSQGQYIGALTDTDKAQIEADKAAASAGQAAKGGIGGVVGKVIGSIF